MSIDGFQRGSTPDVSPPATRHNALPKDVWTNLWSPPDPTPLSWTRLRRFTRSLAEEVVCRDEFRAVFAPLVGSHDLRRNAIHRWFTYKEGFSPALLGRVIDVLGLDGPLNVVDAFGGVATTALAGQFHPAVSAVRSVEYSPFAQFAGEVKLSWPRLDSARLRTLVVSALAYPRASAVTIPDLAAFANPRIFHHATLASLLSAREHLRTLRNARDEERNFLLLGLAAVIEDLSGAMKDGRALRIKEGRRRRPSSFARHPTTYSVNGRVQQALAGQWTAMLEDLEALAPRRATALKTDALHLRGDARDLAAIRLNDDASAFPENWADLSCFSPPYLNSLDYTELYKLELWMLEYITDQSEFRSMRLGTLRSHPSVRFQSRDYFDGEDGPDIELIQGITDWVTQQGARREVGPVIREYFEDMLKVWREQHRVLRPGGTAVCVVANSTFARREPPVDGIREERWRMPLLTDVLLAHMARRAGFPDVEIWPARDLRPRNARAGQARESLVVARNVARCSDP